MSFVKRNILFVDDDPMAQALVSSMLTQAGYIVTCVEDGFEALELVHKYSFDLLILDIMLTKMNGLDLLKRIKSQPTTRDLPVIMLSSRDDQQIIRRAIQMGVQDYIVKPPQRTLFLRKIENILGGRPRFSEVSLQQGSSRSECDFVFPGQILSIGEAGATLSSLIHLEVNSFYQIKSNLFKEIGIETSKFKVVHCEPEDERFTIYINFIGLKAEEVQALREWVISQALKGARTVA